MKAFARLQNAVGRTKTAFVQTTPPIINLRTILILTATTKSAWPRRAHYSSGNLIDGILTADITDNQQVLDADGNLIADHASLRVWTPICLGVGQTITLKGNGHVISGIFANKENGEIEGIALFGTASANISNLGVVDSYFGSLESYGEYYTATFVGYSNASVIENCFSFATVNTGFYSGGIVGLPEETEIKNMISDKFFKK